MSSDDNCDRDIIWRSGWGQPTTFTDEGGATHNVEPNQWWWAKRRATGEIEIVQICVWPDGGPEGAMIRALSVGDEQSDPVYGWTEAPVFDLLQPVAPMGPPS